MNDRPLVMVVDDDADIREAVADVLSDEGYPVELASNGREALDVLRAGAFRPNLILLDLMMPELDGWGLMAELEKRPELAEIPIVVFSAQGVSAEAVACMNVCGFLRKPLRLQDLLELVGRCAMS
jgi:CheY-like chemotaxis protein